MVCYKAIMPYDLLIAYGFACIATAAILVSAHRLSRRYLRDYASDYYHYLLLSASLALLGKPFPVLIAGFVRLQETQADRFYLLFDRLLAKPLWILSLFLLCKCVLAWRSRKPSRPFVIGSAVGGGGYLILGWVFMMDFLQAGRFSPAGLAFNAVHNYLDVFAAMAIFGMGILLPSRVSDKNPQSGARIFCWIGLVCAAVFWALIFRVHSFIIPFLAGVARPIPALIYLKMFLRKTAAEPAIAADHPEAMGLFARKFAITPREMEIVGLICAGRGNQAIADALFISVHTVKRHINQVYQKASLRNRVQLANAVRESAKGSPVER